jgi:hypothetical protein
MTCTTGANLAPIPGKTRWESAQYRRDGGRRMAVALAHKLFADFLREDEGGPCPPACDVVTSAIATGVSTEEGCAAVDRWAARHHLTAQWDRDRAVYFAEVDFGPLRYRVVFVPSDVLDGRLDASDAREDAPRLVPAAA